MTWKVNRIGRHNNNEFLTECFGDEAVHYLTDKSFNPPFICSGIASNLVSITVSSKKEVRVTSMESTPIQLDTLKDTLFARCMKILLDLRGTEIGVILALPKTVYAIYIREEQDARFNFVGHSTLVELRKQYEFSTPTEYTDKSVGNFLGTWNLSGFPAVLVWDNQLPPRLLPRWIGLNTLVDFATQDLSPSLAKEANLIGNEIVWYWVFHCLSQIPTIEKLHESKRHLLEFQLYKHIKN